MPVAPPRSLSPSKVSAFTECPLAFRFSSIDRLPEPPSPPAVKGTLVHAALERLFWHHEGPDRTIEAALDELSAAFDQLLADPEFEALGLEAAQAEEFLDDAETLVRNYFELEDPTAVKAVGMELTLQAALGGLTLRGIIDRLDLRDDGELVVVDYKTGRAPSLHYEQHSLRGVHFYAALCQAVLGRRPVEVRLLHLREPMVLSATPTEQSVRGHEKRTTAVWTAIERACESGDFRPRPSPLCAFCAFQPLCPAHGGTPPPLPEAAADDRLLIPSPA